MITFAICDDELQVHRTLEHYLQLFMSDKDEYKLLHFFDSNLLSMLSKVDFLFLDIQIGEDNGIDLAKKIRKLNKSLPIVLISSNASYLKDGYRTGALRFFTKPIYYQEFYIEMTEIYSTFFQSLPYVENLSKMHKIIFHKDIIYIEVMQHKTFVYTTRDVHESNLSLQEWQNILLISSFIQVHRSFLINPAHVHDFTSKKVILKNGLEVPLSRTYKQSFEDELLKYLEI